MHAEMQYQLDPTHEELDGVLVLRAALRYGFDVSLYPRQVFLAARADGSELSFVHGLPGTSGLGPVTYAQDKRMRRALMERNGVPVPRGATFTMGRGINGAEGFAASLGFPVVIKPAMGDNVIETFPNLRDVPAMHRALDYLRTSPSERAGFSRAAYGLTELREPGEEHGRVVVPPGYLFMVEKHLKGAYLRFLVIEGQVRSVIRCEGNPGDGSLSRGEEIVERVHPELKGLAQRAAAVIPGLPVVTIDLVTPDPYAAVDGQDLGFVEYSERPGLWVQAVVERGLAQALGEEIFLTYAASEGYVLADVRDSVSVDFEARAVPDVAEGAEAIISAASRLGLDVELTRTDQVSGVVYGNLAGDPGAIGDFANALLNGTIENQRVMLAVLQHR